MMDNFLREKIKQHVISVQSFLYRTVSGGICEVMPYWVRGYSGLQIPVFNGFMPLQPRGLTDDTLADTEAFYSTQDTLYAVELIHDLVPYGADFLNKRNYQSLPPQMAMMLQRQPEHVEPNHEVELERVKTVPSLTAFCTLLNEVFDFPVQDMIKWYPVSHLKREEIQLYLAFLDEQPVGTGALICIDGVATLTHTVTIDAYRQRGVATTLTNHMLAQAQKLGCDIVTLYASAQAFSIYSRLGFEIYTQRQWFLPPGITYE